MPALLRLFAETAHMLSPRSGGTFPLHPRDRSRTGVGGGGEDARPALSEVERGLHFRILVSTIMGTKRQSNRSKTKVNKPIESAILIVRDTRIILDADLASVYGVTTKQLNQSVKRNLDRFPEDFAFQLRKEEHESLRSQSVTSNNHTSRGGRRYLPWVFTEHGALMAANILRS